MTTPDEGVRMNSPSYFERVGERHAAWLIQRYYRRWKRKDWTDQHATHALKDLTRKVEFWVGTERAKELLP